MREIVNIEHPSKKNIFVRILTVGSFRKNVFERIVGDYLYQEGDIATYQVIDKKGEMVKKSISKKENERILNHIKKYIDSYIAQRGLI